MDRKGTEEYPAATKGIEMVIDEESFTAVTSHLRRASDALVDAAEKVAEISDPATGMPPADSELMQLLEPLASINVEFLNLETVLRRVWRTNNPENRLPC